MSAANFLAHPLTSLRAILRKQNVVMSRDLRRIPSGSTVRVSGMLILVHTPPTKSGKRVMFLTLEDEMGLFDVVVFPKTQEKLARIILTSEVLTIEGRLQRKGPGGLSISIVMERALVGLCGPLTKLLGYVVHKKVRNNRQISRNTELKAVCLDCEDNEIREQSPLDF